MDDIVRMFFRGAAREADSWQGTLSGADAYDTALASDGSLIQVGRVRSNSRALVAKRSTSGTLQWALQYAHPSGDIAPAGVTVAAGGEIYAAGGLAGGAFVSKLTSSGSLTWSRTLVPGLLQPSCSFDAVAMHTDGDICLLGTQRGESPAVFRKLIVKVGSDGTLRWQRRIDLTLPSGSYFRSNGSIAVNSAGNIYITSSGFDGTDDFIYLARYNSSGALQGQRSYLRAFSDAAGASIAIDSSDNIYIVGWEDIITSPQPVLLKVDSTGTALWGRTISAGGGTDAYWTGVTTDASGNVYASGQYQSGNSLQLAKFSSSGSLQWLREADTDAWPGGRVSADVMGDNLHIGYWYGLNPNYGAYTLRLPVDGSKTGVYSDSGFIYNSQVYSSTTWTPVVGTPTFSESASTLTYGTDTSATSSSASLSATLFRF